MQHLGDESWGVVGQKVGVHYSFWNWTEDDYSECRIVGYIGSHRFPNGNVSKHTYVIECEGHHYAAPHKTVAGARFSDLAIKRRINKQPPPRLL